MSDNKRVMELLAMLKMHWPEVRLYEQQVEMVRSVALNLETYVVAGNKLGKDFTAGLIALSFFLWPWYYFPEEVVLEVESRVNGDSKPHLKRTRRVVTTSVKEDHLRVLWGEIGRYLSTSKMPLIAEKGGPLVVNYHEVRLVEERESKNPTNYLLGCVSQKGEGMSGHHAEYTLCVGDEASGLDDQVYEFAQGWAKKFLIFGNPNDCTNFFRKGVEAGDLVA